MSTSAMIRGTLVAGRFRIERAAGHGGMSTVYRAQDLQTGQPVALKLLHRPISSDSARTNNRMVVEAQVLAELRHEGIVAYVAHGFTPHGLPFLAMEWIDGEDLSERLERQPLSVPETLTLLGRVAEALSVAHSKGVLHRDLKPSNLFLRNGQIERIVLLDFGVARHIDGPHSITATGMLIGTPDYMAPEQARGERPITASVDIFSLGCVVYRCLVGHPPFGGQHISAMMAKLFSDETPRLAELRPDLPSALVDLVMRMLSKSPLQRPADGDALLRELACLRDLPTAELPSVTAAVPLPLHLFRHEERLVSVVMSSPQAAGLRPGETADVVGNVNDVYLKRVTLRQRLAELHAHAEFLADDSIVAFLSEPSEAEDIAVLAVRCALLIQHLCAIPFVAVATGSGRIQLQRPLGEAVDRVAEFFHMLDHDPSTPLQLSQGAIVVDEVTAGLLNPHHTFVRIRPGLFVLDPLGRPAEGPRALLGRIPPCIGRERQLALLMASLHESEEESIARVALFVGEAGIGKSRLLSTFLERAAEPDQGQPRSFLHAAAVSTEADDPYALLRRLLLRMISAEPDEQSETALDRLRERIDTCIAPVHRQDTLRVLANVCRLSPPSFGVPHRGAVSDSLVHDPVSLAFLRFLGSICGRQTVVLAVDNLQWADGPSIRLIDLALRALASMPLFVIALARPAVSRRYPRLWSEHRVQEIQLSPLAPTDCLALARSIVADALPRNEVQRCCDLSMGNPRYLEELLRARLEGDTADIPATLIAMLQGRLMSLPEDARSLLRAASVFHGSFSVLALCELVQADIAAAEVDRLLQLLCDLSLLVWDRRLPRSDMNALRFREAVIREAARSLISPDVLRKAERRIAASGQDRNPPREE